mgnify:CR=1 FL=1
MATYPARRSSAFWIAVPMLCLLVLPVIALFFASSPAALSAGMEHELFMPALWLSIRTTALSLLLIVVLGTPLAWWLASASSKRRRMVELLVDLPIVLPPAVVGIALLQTFGRSGWLGEWNASIPFTTTAVVLAQVLVSAPFYIQSAAQSFRRVDRDLLIVARTLGRSRTATFFRVALPLARPGLIGGAALAWARAIGEFGATLLFAGNMPGTTQTMPLAIYTALESDVRAAIALSVVLAGIAVLLLFVLRFVWSTGLRRPRLHRGGGSPR